MNVQYQLIMKTELLIFMLILPSNKDRILRIESNIQVISSLHILRDIRHIFASSDGQVLSYLMRCC